MTALSMPPTRRVVRILIVAGLAGLALSGCVPRLVRPTPPVSAAGARAAVAQGRYLEGGQAYQHLARHATGTRRARFLLKAAEALVHAGAIRPAQRELARVTPPLPGPLMAHRDILKAEIHAALRKPRAALREAEAAHRFRRLKPRLLAEIDRVGAQAALSLHRPLIAARDLIEREGLLVSPRRLTANEHALWRSLAGVSTRKLRDLARRYPGTPTAAWARLALAARRYPPHSQRLHAALARWRHRYPKDIPTQAFLTFLLGAKQRLGQAPRAVALLLPLSRSPFAKAARAVEKGFLAMARQDPMPGKPRLFVYDTGAHAKTAVRDYRAAVDRGAQLIVGPLGAAAVDQVVAHVHFRVPTLLLGRTHAPIVHNSEHVPVYQFSLARTEEARQVADRAYLDGHMRAAILYPKSGWGRRMQRAFARRWRHLGGLVTARGSYKPGSTDYVRPVENLLNISQSRARDERLQRILGTPLAFTARRRQDVGFLFLVADAPDARLIKPLLDYDHADNLPVYSTSSVFTGRRDPVYDRDLDGITFGDMPWMLVGNGRTGRLRSALAHAHHYEFRPLGRLYAFGADAEGLAGRLDRLRLGGRYDGLTGALSVRRDGVVRRQLVFAQFRAGLARLVNAPPHTHGLFRPPKPARP